jgi:predicted amidohydrolase
MSSPLRLSPGQGIPAIVTQWQTIASTSAFLLSCYVACVNRVGNEDSFTYWGNSAVTAPDGSLAACAPMFREHSFDATIDYSAVKRVRLQSSHFLDEDIKLFASQLETMLGTKLRG